MKHFQGAAALALFLAGAQAVSAGDRTCPVKVGETVTFATANQTAQAVKVKDIVRDEFESLEAFEARKAAAGPINRPEQVIVAGNYDPRYVTYDPDAERYRINKWAWARVNSTYEKANYAVNKAYYDAQPTGAFRAPAAPVFGVGLSWVVNAYDTAEASNAMGAKTTITKTMTTAIGIFDTSLPDARSYRDPRLPGWDVVKEPAQSREFSFSDTDEVAYFDLPLEEAQKLRKDFLVGFAARPKAPYFWEQSEMSEATFSNPVQDMHFDHVIIADIQCAILTDLNGKVLTTIGVIASEGTEP